MTDKPRNILFITIDSCAYETAARAKTPNLDKLGAVRKAETFGTYTYPSHCSFFSGKLPDIAEGEDRLYLRKYQNIWRSSFANDKGSHVHSLFSFNNKNIIEYHQKNGYQTIGAGGVSFFDPARNGNSLPDLFEKFEYFGPSQNLPRNEKIPRKPEWFPLRNVEKILNHIDMDRPFFLFINTPETHIPYDYPGLDLDDAYKNLIKRLYREHDFKNRHDTKDLPFTETEIKILKNAQLLALEEVDRLLGNLFKKVAKSKLETLVVVCADHGEEFGEGGRFGHAHSHATVLTVPIWDGIIETEGN